METAAGRDVRDVIKWLQGEWIAIRSGLSDDPTVGIMFRLASGSDEQPAWWPDGGSEWAGLWSLAASVHETSAVIHQLKTTEDIPAYARHVAVVDLLDTVGAIERQAAQLALSLRSEPTLNGWFALLAPTDIRQLDEALCSEGYSIHGTSPRFATHPDASHADLLARLGFLGNEAGAGFADDEQSLDLLWWNCRRPGIADLLTALVHRCRAIRATPLPEPVDRVPIDESLAARLLAGLPDVWDLIRFYFDSAGDPDDSFVQAWTELHDAVTNATDDDTHRALTRVHEELARVAAGSIDGIEDVTAEFELEGEIAPLLDERSRVETTMEVFAGFKVRLLHLRDLYRSASELARRTTPQDVTAAGWANVPAFPDVDEVLEPAAKELGLPPSAVAATGSADIARHLGIA